MGTTMTDLPLCKEQVYGRSFNDPPRPCRAPATKDGFCHSHHPRTVERRERKAIANAEERVRVRGLAKRKLALIPLLDKCRKARLRIPPGSEQMRLGATVILNEIERAIREK